MTADSRACTRPLCGVLLGALLAGCAGPAPTASGDAKCLGPKLGELPMVQTSNGFFVVPMYFGEHPRGMIVDTGSSFNLIYQATLAEEGLKETADHQYSGLVEGVTGVQRHGFTSVPLLRFAGIRLEDAPMAVLAIDPPKFDLLPVAGLLGTPYLSVFDIEMDVPGETLSLYGRARCDGIRPPWQGAYSTEPLATVASNMRQRTQDVEGHSTVKEDGLGEPNRAQIMVNVHVNGHPLRAVFDTGATTSMRPDIAQQAGLVAAADARRVTAGGVDGGQVEGRVERAGELRFGDDTYRDKAVGVFPFVNVGPGMLVGRDVLRGKRVFISFKERVMFVQPSDSKP